MPRGGKREGAGRKPEYNEPVRPILLKLPESALQQLDEYAQSHGLSRPKAIMKMLDGIAQPKKGNQKKTKKLLAELQELRESLR